MGPSNQISTKPTILVVGSINADLIAYVDDTKRIGNYVFGEDFRFNLGGKGLNQAMNVVGAGTDVILIGRVGNDSFGHEIIRQLDKRRIRTNFIVRDVTAHTGIGHVRVNRTGEYDTVVINGANSFLDISQIDSIDFSSFNLSYVLMNFEILSHVVSHSASKFRKLGAKIIINLSPITEGIPYKLSDADYLITNQDEARAVLKTNESDIRKLAELLRREGARNVVITRGSEGVIGIDEEENFFSFKREPVTVENTIGAGDTFLAVFAVALNLGSSFEHSLEIANFSAALVCAKKESFLSETDLATAGEKFGISFPQLIISEGSERLHD